MKSNKGQALVEFILILPIFLIIILGIIDFGKIFYAKYTLQNDLALIADLYSDNNVDEYNNYANNHKLNLKITTNNHLTTLQISKSIEINTPGLNRALGDNYELIESITVQENETE